MPDMSLTSATYRQKDQNLGKVIIWHKICFIRNKLSRCQLMIYFTKDKSAVAHSFGDTSLRHLHQIHIEANIDEHVQQKLTALNLADACHLRYPYSTDTDCQYL